MDNTPLASPRGRIRIEECIDPAHVDGHRKPVYSDTLIPRGLVGRLGAILGCRALVLLHDEQGHPLLATTHRVDQHLMVGLPSIIERYVHSKEHEKAQAGYRGSRRHGHRIPGQFARRGTNSSHDLTHQAVSGSDLILRRGNLSSASVPMPKARSSEKWPLLASP